MSIFEIAVTLFVIMNAVGSVPVIVALLKHFDQRRQQKIIFRELLFALVLMIVFCFFGEGVLELLSLSIPMVRIAGGVLLFLISLSMLFPKEECSANTIQQEPFIVPIATPLIAGPATLAAIMIFTSQEKNSLNILFGIFCAWVPALIILLMSAFLKRILGDKVLAAFERLAGYILTCIAVQMFVAGVNDYTMVVLVEI